MGKNSLFRKDGLFSMGTDQWASRIKKKSIKCDPCLTSDTTASILESVVDLNMKPKHESFH